MSLSPTRMAPQDAVLQAMLDKEMCRALSDWSSVADVIHHHEHGAGHGHKLTTTGVLATLAAMVSGGFVTHNGGNNRWRLTDPGRDAAKVLMS